MLSWMCVLCVIVRVLLWRSLKEFVVYAATTYIQVVYEVIWEVAVGEVLSYEKEACNTHDCYAVAVKVTGTTDIVRHLPTLLDTFIVLIIRCGKYFFSLLFIAARPTKMF